MKKLPLLLPLLLAGALFASGCNSSSSDSSSSDSSKKEITAAFNNYASGLDEGDWAKVCDSLTAKAQTSIFVGIDLSNGCAEGVGKAIKKSPKNFKLKQLLESIAPKGIEIKEIKVSGDSATALSTVGKSVAHVTFAFEGGEWKIQGDGGPVP